MSKASAAPALFLTDAALRRGFDLLLVSYRHYRDGIDDTLRAAGLGQAHHRAIYFIYRNDGVSPMELCELLSITKQSLRRVILDLLEGGFIEARPSKVDRRRKHYSLTPKGAALESSIYAVAEERMVNAYTEAGPEAVKGFWEISEAIVHAPQKPPPAA